MGEQFKKELWYVLVEGIVDEDHAAVGNFYGYGDHLGEVAAHVLAAARKEGFIEPHMGEAYFVEPDYEMPDDLVTLSEHVQWSPTRYVFPLADYQSALVLPTGITHATYESENDPDLIQEAFYTYGYEKNSQGEYALDIVAGQDRLKETFFSCIRLLSDANGLFVRLMDFWEDDAVEVWAYYDDDIETLVELLSSNLPDTVENGYVEVAITASDEQTKTTLILDPHKHIRFFTQDERLFKEAVRQTQRWGFPETETFYHIEAGYYHWHYRPLASHTRKGFIQWLEDSGFERVG